MNFHAEPAREGGRNGKTSVPGFHPEIHAEKRPETRRELLFAIAADATRAADSLLEIARSAIAAAREDDRHAVEERFASGLRIRD